MYEVEVKARLKDRKEVFEKLQSVGCIWSGELHQVDDIFSRDSDITSFAKDRPILRIRDENGKFILTLKMDQSSKQDCIEHESEVGDKGEMEKILGILGFRKEVTVDKVRIKTKYKDMEIVLDTVKELGEFIEAEKMTDEADPEARKKIQEDLYEFLETLGVTKEDKVIDGKYDVMILEKNSHKL